MTARDKLYAYAGTPCVLPESMLDEALDAYRTEVLAKAVGRLRAIPVTCTALTGPVWYGDGWNSAITVLEEIADYQTPDDEAYPGELQRLRSLVLGLRVAALRKGDLAQVQWLLTDHEETREKATDAQSATATPQSGDPLTIRWDREVWHAESDADDTIVCCLTDDGQPVALLLDDEHREALGLLLVDPTGESEHDGWTDVTESGDRS
jgi:hypothetical protein